MAGTVMPAAAALAAVGEVAVREAGVREAGVRDAAVGGTAVVASVMRDLRHTTVRRSGPTGQQ